MSKRETWFIYGLMGYAILTRLIQYFHNRSLWFDEASLALNIKERDFIGLLQPLGYDQGAPVPFLLITKLLYTLFGGSEYVLRLLPLVTSILCIFLLWWLCRRMHPTAAVVALAYFATSSHAIYYASEFKQYTGDMAIAMALFVLITHLLEKPSPRLFITAAIAGAVAVWCSHPALFVLAGCGFTLLVYALWTKRLPVLWVLALGVVWVGSFALAYGLIYQHLAASEFMQDFWKSAFFQLDAVNLILTISEILTHITDFYQPALFILTMAGLVMGLRRVRPLYSALLLAPLLFTLVASLMHLYPISGRLLLFLTPAIMLLVGAGFSDALRTVWSASRPAAGVLIAILAVMLFSRTQYVQDRMELRDTIRALLQNEPETLIYIDPYRGRIARYYEFPVLPLAQLDTLEKLGQPVWVVMDIVAHPDTYRHLGTIARLTGVFGPASIPAYRYEPRP